MADQKQTHLGKTLWGIGNMTRRQDGELLNTLQAGFKYIENDSFQSTSSSSGS